MIQLVIDSSLYNSISNGNLTQFNPIKFILAGLAVQIWAWGGQVSDRGGVARDSPQNLEVSQKSKKNCIKVCKNSYFII